MHGNIVAQLIWKSRNYDLVEKNIHSYICLKENKHTNRTKKWFDAFFCIFTVSISDNLLAMTG